MLKRALARMTAAVAVGGATSARMSAQPRRWQRPRANVLRGAEAAEGGSSSSDPGASPSAAVRRRVLCLHGYGMDPAAMPAQLQAGTWREAWAEVGVVPELVGLEGPHVPAERLRGAAAGGDAAPSRCWWHARGGSDSGDGEEFRYVGAVESMVRVAEALEREAPVDCLLGFSQGAALAALCLASLGAAPRAAVLVSGFRPRDCALAVELQAMRGPAGARLRTLHVVGARDALIEPEESRALSQVFAQHGHAQVFLHGAGHGAWRRSADVQRAICRFVAGVGG